MNVSSLTPLLPDFHTVQFSVSSELCFVFKFVVVLFLVVRGGTVCLPTPSSRPEDLPIFNLHIFFFFLSWKSYLFILDASHLLEMFNKY